MGADNSKEKLSLAEKRYRIERPPIRKVRHSKSAGDVNRITKDLRKVALTGTISQSPSCSGFGHSTSIESDVSTMDCKSESSEPTRLPNELPTTSKTQRPESVLARPLVVEQRGHFLTRRERMLLEHSWKKCKKTGAEHVGSKIFLMVLTAQPDIKAIFGLEKIPQGRLKYDPRFRQHALVFTRTFDFVIKNIEFPDKLEQHFENLGRRHVAMQGRGFDPLYWETFAECMTQAAVEWEAHKQRLTLSAWRTLISTIITFMRRGFDDENSKRKHGTLLPKRLPSSYSNNNAVLRRITVARF